MVNLIMPNPLCKGTGDILFWGEAIFMAGYTLLPNPSTNLAGNKKEEDT